MPLLGFTWMKQCNHVQSIGHMTIVSTPFLLFSCLHFAFSSGSQRRVSNFQETCQFSIISLTTWEFRYALVIIPLTGRQHSLAWCSNLDLLGDVWPLPNGIFSYNFDTSHYDLCCYCFQACHFGLRLTLLFWWGKVFIVLHGVDVHVHYWHVKMLGPK